jgi:hypothetical protein
LTVRYNKIENATTFGVGLSDSNINAHIYNNDISLGNPGSGAVPSVANAGIRVGPGNDNVVIEKNNISNCPGTSALPGAGIRLQSTGSMDVKGNNITSCPIGIRITADAADISKIKVNNNSISGNDFGLSVAVDLSGGPLDATQNWWGTAAGSIIAANVSANVNYTPWYTNAGMTTVGNDAKLSAGTLAGIALDGAFTGGGSIGSSSGLTVAISSTLAASPALVLTQSDSNSVVNFVIGTVTQPTDAEYTGLYTSGMALATTLTSDSRVWLRVTAPDGTILYYWIIVTVS